MTHILFGDLVYLGRAQNSSRPPFFSNTTPRWSFKKQNLPPPNPHPRQTKKRRKKKQGDISSELTQETEV